MYSGFQSFVDQLVGAERKPIEYQARHHELAVAVLLYKIIQVDGREREQELRYFKEICKEKLGVASSDQYRFENSVKTVLRSPETVDLMIAELRKASADDQAEVFQWLEGASLSDREFHELEMNFIVQLRELLAQ